MCAWLGLGAAPDTKIWGYARSEGFTVVTMDDDFQHFAARYGTPPQVVWIRLGNVRKHELLNVMLRVLPQLRSSLENGVAVIEIT